MNNIQQTVSQLNYLAQSQDANTGKTLGYVGALKAMGVGLIGTNGVLLGIMAVTTALGFLLDNTGKTDKAIEDFTGDTRDLNEQLKLLKGNFDDIVQGAKNTRDELIKGGIAEQQKIIDGYQSLIDKGGLVVRGQKEMFSPVQMKSFQNEIDVAKSKIESYNAQLKKGNEFANINIGMLKKLASVASTEGLEGVKKFAAENKLSEAQLKNLIEQLNYYKESVLSISGGLAKELAPGVREIALQLGLQSKETKSAVEILNTYFDKIKAIATIPSPAKIKFEFEFEC